MKSKKFPKKGDLIKINCDSFDLIKSGIYIVFDKNDNDDYKIFPSPWNHVCRFEIKFSLKNNSWWKIIYEK